MMTAKIFISALFILISVINKSQDLVMEIKTNHGDYKAYGRGLQDTIFITYSIKNISAEQVKFRWDNGFFSLGYADDGFSHSHCFTVYPGDFSKMYVEDYNRTKESFMTLQAGEEFTRTEPFDISWLCRGAPPVLPWEFKLSYEREITKEDNYILLKRYYTDIYDKEFIEGAWTGHIKSNSVKITLTQ